MDAKQLECGDSLDDDSKVTQCFHSAFITSCMQPATKAPPLFFPANVGDINH